MPTVQIVSHDNEISLQMPKYLRAYLINSVIKVVPQVVYTCHDSMPQLWQNPKRVHFIAQVGDIHLVAERLSARNSAVLSACVCMYICPSHFWSPRAPCCGQT